MPSLFGKSFSVVDGPHLKLLLVIVLIRVTESKQQKANRVLSRHFLTGFE